MSVTPPQLCCGCAAAEGAGALAVSACSVRPRAAAWRLGGLVLRGAGRLPFSHGLVPGGQGAGQVAELFEQFRGAPLPEQLAREGATPWRAQAPPGTRVVFKVGAVGSPFSMVGLKVRSIRMTTVSIPDPRSSSGGGARVGRRSSPCDYPLLTGRMRARAYSAVHASTRGCRCTSSSWLKASKP